MNKVSFQVYLLFVQILVKSSMAVYMENYIDRLVTFSTWPDSSLTSTVLLTENGFFYIGEGDRVQCYSCLTILGDWQEEDVPYIRHLQYSPHCHIATSQAGASGRARINDTETENNHLVGISQRDESRNHIQNNLNRIEAGQQNANHESLGPERCLNHDLCSLSETPIPDFNIYHHRILSFKGNWPTDSPITPSELADAGFYFLGPSDRVQCAWCKGIIYKWEQGDTGIGEHKRHFPDCPLIKTRIDELLSKPKNIVKNNTLKGQTTKHSRKDELIEKNDISIKKERKDDLYVNIEEQPAVKIVIEMGYSSDIVHMVVHEMLANENIQLDTGKLLDRLFEYEKDNTESIINPKKHVTNVKDEPSNPLEGAVGYAYGFLTEEKLSNQRLADNNDKSSSVQNITANDLLSPKKELNVTNSNNDNHPWNDTNKEYIRKPMPENQAYLPERLDSLQEDIDNISKLTDENLKLRGTTTCKVCLEKGVDLLFLPCRHLVCCVECGNLVNLCPMCRTVIAATVKTFLS